MRTKAEEIDGSSALMEEDEYENPYQLQNGTKQEPEKNVHYYNMVKQGDGTYKKPDKPHHSHTDLVIRATATAKNTKELIEGELAIGNYGRQTSSTDVLVYWNADGKTIAREEVFSSTIKPTKVILKVKPLGKVPLHHEFLTTAALDIYDAAQSRGASAQGSLLCMAQASLESLYGKEAIKNGDFNLFGTMTLGNDYKATTSHGRLKDFSKVGGYKASIAYYFDKNERQWPKFSELIKKESFTADDIDQAFYTGQYYEWPKTRNKTGHYSYNFNNIDETKMINNNHYGTSLLSQMSDFKKRFVGSLTYQMTLNENKVVEHDMHVKSGTGVWSISAMEQFKKDRATLVQQALSQNKRLETIKNALQ